MGVQLSTLVPKKETSIKKIRNRTVAIDAFNYIYQFLSSIRQRNGTPLKDSKGRVTSHLSGLFYRNINLLEENITPVYVFDGEHPDMKRKEIENRNEVREKAKEKWKEKKEKGEFTSAKKYAQMSSKIEKDQLKSSKKLLNLMGIPIVQAPAEGEAQASYIVQNNDSWAVASQDYDSLLYGSPRTIRNLVKEKPKIINLKRVLEGNEIDREQLIELSILIGTDFNPDGIKGIGPVKGLKIVKEESFDDYSDDFETDPYKIKDLFLNPDVIEDYSVERSEPDTEGIMNMLDDYDFSQNRLQKGLNKIRKSYEKGEQSNLESWM